MENEQGFKFATIFGLIFFAIGIILLILGYKLNIDYKEKSNKYIETEGIVVDYKYGTGKSKNTKAIIVEYYVDDIKYRKTSNIYTSNPKKIGSTEIVKYDPKNPKNMIFEKDMDSFILYLIGGIFSGVGATFTIIFMILYNKSKKNIFE